MQLQVKGFVLELAGNQHDAHARLFLDVGAQHALERTRLLDQGIPNSRERLHRHCAFHLSSNCAFHLAEVTRNQIVDGFDAKFFGILALHLCGRYRAADEYRGRKHGMDKAHWQIPQLLTVYCIQTLYT